MADYSMLKRILTKLRQYPVAIAALGFAAIIAVTITVRSSTLSELEHALEDREREWSRVSNNLKRARDLEAHLEQITEANEAVGKRLMDPSEVAINHDYFYQLERAAGVRLTTLNQGGVVPTRGSNIAGIEEFKQYQLVGYTIALEGEFTNVVAFLNQLRNGHYFARISAFTANRARQAESGIVSANLQVQILGIPHES